MTEVVFVPEFRQLFYIKKIKKISSLNINRIICIYLIFYQFVIKNYLIEPMTQFESCYFHKTSFNSKLGGKN